MPVFKGTYLFSFSGTPPCGFSETWYTVAADRSEAAARFGNYGAVRVRCLANQWTLQTIRLTQLSVVGSKFKGKSLFLCPPPSPLTGTAGDADTPTTSLLVRFTTGTVADPALRNQQLRGIPDSWWTSGALSMSNAQKALVNNLGVSLHANNMGTAGIEGGVGFVNVVRCAEIRRISERRIGRPFFLLRGSRRRKKV